MNDTPSTTPAQEIPPVEVTPRPSKLTLAPPLTAPIPMKAAVINTGAQPVSCASGILYILMRDYTVGLVTAPKFVQVVTETQSVGNNLRNQFSSSGGTQQAPVVSIESVTMPSPPPTEWFAASSLIDVPAGTTTFYTTTFLSDEVAQRPPFDVPNKVSYYVFTDAASTPNEVGRVRCDRVSQWSDQMPLLLGS